MSSKWRYFESFPEKFPVIVMALLLSAGTTANAQTVDLADIIGGGNGSGTGGNLGISLIDGSTTGSHTGTVSAPTNTYTLAANPLVDGVFIPDGGPGGSASIQISSTGLTVTGISDSTGFGGNNAIHSWDHIWNGDNTGISTAVVGTRMGVAPNKGITFDLDAIEAANGGQVLSYDLTAVTGNNSAVSSDFYVFVDGILADSTSLAGSNQFENFTGPVNPDARFLTLITSSSGDIGNQWAYWIDATIATEPITVDVVDLADIVGAGNGSGTGGNFGISLIDGAATASHASIVNAPTNTYTLAANPLVDGVFIPDGGPGGSASIQISSTGLSVSGISDSTGFGGDPTTHSWDHIWNGDNTGISTTVTGTRLGVAANKGITFDLDAIEAANNGAPVTSYDLTAATGNVSAASPDFYVFVDGILAHSTSLAGANQSENFVGPLNANARFLTLITSSNGDIGNQWAYWINASIKTDPIPFPTPTRGIYVSGGSAELLESDGADYVMRRNSTDLQSRTEFELKSVSPTATPTSFEFTLEGSVFARGNVVQTIELFDYVADAWELVDTTNAARAPMPDKVVTATPTGDLSRFVEAGTRCIEARILYKSDRNRQRFASNTDQAVWIIQ